MTTGEIIGLLATSGLVSVLLTYLLSIHQTKRDIRRKGTHAAIRLATLLEKFVLDCVEQVQDINNAFSSNGQAGEFHDKLPKLQEYPSEIDWEAVEPNLAANVLSFTNEVVVSNRVIWGCGKFVGNEEAFEECLRQCAIQGLRAYVMSRELRKEYKLGAPDYMTKLWDCPGYLEAEKQRYEEQRKAMEEASQKATQGLWDNISS